MRWMRGAAIRATPLICNVKGSRQTEGWRVRKEKFQHLPSLSSSLSLSLRDVLCPRCKESSRAGTAACERCGYSFAETGIFAERTPFPEGVATRALSGDDDASDALGEHATAAERPIGEEILAGRYRALAVLGEGGFGTVYKVEFLLFGEPTIFAMKVLRPEIARVETARRRFAREARLSMSLAHENIVQTREFGEGEDGCLYYTMDLCRGEPMSELLAQFGVLPLLRVVAVVRQVLRALVAAHERGIVHRDLKPSNIFIERDSHGRDRVRVGDFGLAKSIVEKHAERDSDITLGGIVGSPRYMSPEQANGGDLDYRTDLFSLGMIFHEALYGSVPDDPEARIEELGGSSPRQSVPAEVRAILKRALAAESDERYASAEEFLEDVEALEARLEGSLSEDSDGSPEPAAARLAPESARRLPQLVAVFALLALAALFLALARPDHDGDAKAHDVARPPQLQHTGELLYFSATDNGC
jgi:serine/threonine protein kinase